jgi:hypothetical protein
VIRKQVTHAARPSATGRRHPPPPSSRSPGAPPGPA